ncbi:MAG: hypothetical protein KKC39_06825 [Candidatus Omnitrophica bacterium]|nr:hypothetical protein [Candidatus Omnitrophota bacterium]MBU4303573.1 hypothetical protein [Candidatus Omnitrophota bacterium]MBU4468432.1 hypothetical protein [Candidatus Omnitrophota bacterium]
MVKIEEPENKNINLLNANASSESVMVMAKNKLNILGCQSALNAAKGLISTNGKSTLKDYAVKAATTNLIV